MQETYQWIVMRDIKRVIVKCLTILLLDIGVIARHRFNCGNCSQQVVLDKTCLSNPLKELAMHFIQGAQFYKWPQIELTIQCTPPGGEKSRRDVQARLTDWIKVPSSVGAVVGLGTSSAYHRPLIWNIRDHGMVDAFGSQPLWRVLCMPLKIRSCCALQHWDSYQRTRIDSRE